MNDKNYIPAFPVDAYIINKGMTLRDYFAAKALNGIMSRVDGYHPEDNHNKIAEWCYHMADAMMGVKEK